MNLKNLFLCALAVFIFTTPQPLYCPTAQDYLQQAFTDYSDLTGEPFEDSPFAMGFAFAITAEDTENPFPEITEVEELYERLITSDENPDFFEFIDGFLHGHSMLFKHNKGKLERHGLKVEPDNSFASCSTSYARGQQSYKGDETNIEFVTANITPLIDHDASSTKTLVIKMNHISFFAGMRKAFMNATATDLSLLPEAKNAVMADGHQIRKNNCSSAITLFLDSLTLTIDADTAAEEDIARLQAEEARQRAELARQGAELARYQEETASLQATLTKLQAQITEHEKEEMQLWLNTQKGSRTNRKAAVRKHQLAQQRERFKQEQERLRKLLTDTDRHKPAPVAPRSAAVQKAVEAGIDAALSTFAVDEALEAEKVRATEELKLRRKQKQLRRKERHLMREEEKRQRKYESALRRYQAIMSKAGQKTIFSATQPNFAPLPEPAAPADAKAPSSVVVTAGLEDEIIDILQEKPVDDDSASSVHASCDGTTDTDDDDDDTDSVVVDSGTLSVSAAASAERHDTTLSTEVLTTTPHFAAPLPLLPPPGPYLDGFLRGRNSILYWQAKTKEHFINNMLCHAHSMIQQIQALIAQKLHTSRYCEPEHYVNKDYWIGIYNGACNARHLLATYYQKGLHAGRYNDIHRKTNITTEIAAIASTLEFDHLNPRLNLKNQFNLGFEHGQAAPTVG